MLHPQQEKIIAKIASNRNGARPAQRSRFIQQVFSIIDLFLISETIIYHDTKNYNSSHEKTSRSSVMLEESYMLADFIFIFENVRFIFIQICIALLDKFFFIRRITRNNISCFKNITIRSTIGIFFME